MSAEPTWFLVQCVKKKHARPLAAKELYCSDWFLKARQYVERQGGRWLILSAKHGVVEPDRVIAPYEVTLNNKTAAACRLWAESVAGELYGRIRSGDRVVMLAGEVYRQHLSPG